ncbi:MAG: hypothetical protein DRG83_21535, partial [Deltaproteobacteria bacterium]
MNKDIRIAVSFFDHPKTVKLKRTLGWEGIICLQRLWCFAAQYKPSGLLDNMDEADIEIAARWEGKEGEFIAALIKLRWLDYNDEDSTYSLHDWAEHNPYCFHAEERSRIAKKAAEARWKKCKENKDVMHKACEEQCTEHAKSNASRNAPSPSPSPIPSPIPSPTPVPSPSPKDTLVSSDEDTCPQTEPADANLADELSQKATTGKKQPPPCPHKEIIELYHEILPELPRVMGWKGTREQYLRTRWREDPQRQDLGWWREFFQKVRESDFLMGRVPPRNGDRPFMADLEWLVRPNNFLKVLEGRYR